MTIGEQPMYRPAHASSGHPIPVLVPPTNPFERPLTSPPTRAVYADHRTEREAAQRAILLDRTVPLRIDPILSSILARSPPDFSLDKRHNLTVWTRPCRDVRALVLEAQGKLQRATNNAKGIWYPPASALHMTVLEIGNSFTPETLSPLITALRPHVASLTALPSDPITLDAPLLTYDASGLALSFLPLTNAYHRLRARLWAEVRAAGIDAKSRYVAPSAHVTIARFVEGGVGVGREELVGILDGVKEDVAKWKGEWRLESLEVRAGNNWYGGGYGVEGKKSKGSDGK